jgi:outer membrane protein assembly factor BamB
VSVANGRIYTTGIVDGNGYLFSLDRDGRLKWKTSYGPEWTKNYVGARTTPTVDGDRVYVMSGRGRVACFSAEDGAERWAVDTQKEFGQRAIRWGHAESVLIHGNLAVCTPGGEKALMVALDKMTGKTVWTCSGLDDKAAYCSPLLIDDGERRLITTATAKHIVGIDIRNGDLLWKYPYENQWQAHANTPLYHDGGIYVTSGYDKGGIMLRLSPDGKKVTLAWQDETLDNHHGGAVVVDGYIYGSSWKGNRDGNWVCLDWETGEVKYDTPWENKGQIVFAEGMLYCYTEKSGMVGLVKATPDGFKPVGSFQVTEGTNQHWAHPAIAEGVLYIRHGDTLLAYDIKAD